MSKLGVATLKNPNLDTMKSDFLYHIDINIPDTRDTSDIQQRFGDVKFVCMGGTKNRMLDLAKYLRGLLEPENKTEEFIDISAAGNRYAIFKVGPVLCCSHGVGMSTMSVVLHELLKLVYYAKCQDPIFIRLGTSGGIGVEPGTVVITKDAYNGYLKNEHEIAILGQRIVRPANFDPTLAQELLECSKGSFDYNVVLGNTMGAECFYEGQGRLDGSSCHYTENDKMAFIQQCYDKGIRNIEMEATMFSSLTKHVGVKAADICVTLINRFEGDQIKITKEQKHDFEQRPFNIVGAYIQKVLAQRK
ncbi:uridine phosphorylase 1 [Lucilia cuprina]|uniref:uridine phosphorylase 1 n=1 Tax=Lucilia cuprina TaxID=7375 RepID=UPI001F065832|nr:uridine phosphorylase 1 [Lucilia cuprina]XP_046806461.1 uridine phosphorylase 1 [Lucilia cuprina]XP_046806462.1 uridine phosphorylase 1 [Lucilia cuprina]